MEKVKFRFNSSSLQYDRIERTVWDRLLRFLAYLTGSLLLGFIYMLVFSYFFDLPKEKQLKRENNQMKA
ncbi:MAG: M23 family peptidase, partial [Bacteroidota bacterium]|nr:M23 family peptidase [Bacteroidota bacterium]